VILPPLIPAEAFGNGGMVSNALSPNKALALQTDGKLVVMGGPRYNAF
jgi:hypothetical protein